MNNNHLKSGYLPKEDRIDYKSCERLRRKMKRRHRFKEGIKQLWCRPWKAWCIIFTWLMFTVILLHIAMIGIAYALENPFFDLFIQGVEKYFYSEGVEINISSILAAVGVSITCVILLFILYALFIFLGKAKGADKIERDIWNAFSIQERFRHRCPFIIAANPACWSNQDVSNKNVLIYEIWSKWIRLNEWKNKDILDTLLDSMNAKLCDDVKHKVKKGGNGREFEDSNIIILTVLPNNKVGSRVAVIDPLFE